MKTDLKIGDQVWIVYTDFKFPEIESCVVTGFDKDTVHCHCAEHDCDFSEFPELCYRTKDAAARCKLSLLIDEQRSLCNEISRTLKEIKDV